VAIGEIDLLLVATMTPDYLCPATSAFIQDRLGLHGIPAMDIQAACSGFVYGLASAKAFIESGMAQNVLLIATEKMSAVTDFSDRTSCILFGDGASAAVISSEGVGFSIDGVELGADGSLAELIMVPAGGARVPASADTVAGRQHFVSLKGQEVFKHAVRRMAEAAEACMSKIGVKADEIDWFIPHQANGRIMEALGKHLGVPEEKVFRTVHKYGNTSAASVGIALDELSKAHGFEEGEKALVVAFGAGLTWGAAALTWK
jgi:3-oxoacyl-[acyl-carrier-protein] synthase-3